MRIPTITAADAESLFWNIVGGIIVAVGTWWVITIREICRCWLLKRIIGPDIGRADDGIIMVYGQFYLPPLADANHQVITHPYRKRARLHGHDVSSVGFSIDHPVGSSEIRATNYAAQLIGTASSSGIRILPDTELETIIDASLITFGAPGSNYKSADVFESDANLFVRVQGDTFVTKTGRAFFAKEAGCDYGIILRISNPDFPKRTWITCAGLGEWGTSGSSWYLSHKWSKLLWKELGWNPLRLFLSTNFAALIRVTPGQDESARLVGFYRTKREIESAADSLVNAG